MLDFGSLSLLNCSINCSWMAPLTLVVICDEGVGFPSVICILGLVGHIWCVCVFWLVLGIYHGSM